MGYAIQYFFKFPIPINLAISFLGLDFEQILLTLFFVLLEIVGSAVRYKIIFQCFKTVLFVRYQ